MNFLGYKRPDDKIGIRNYVLILPTSVCSCDVARKVSQSVQGSVTFTNQSGCAQVGRDFQFTFDTLVGLACNANVYGTVLISLGCETCQLDLVAHSIKQRTNKPLVTVNIQDEGGSINAVEKAIHEATLLVNESQKLKREPFPLSELVIGTECGGSDPTSGIVANPTVGEMSDLVVSHGGTVVLSETPEFIGAEHILAKRAKDVCISNRILEIVRRYEYDLKVVGQNVRHGNPSPGNKDGGLTTLEEKSLGCIHKSGSSKINAVYDYSKEIATKGLVIMDTPGFDSASITGMVAGGCQLCVFTTGLGTPLGHPLIPVIKITGNRNTFSNMSDNIDFDASPALYGEKSLKHQGEELFKMVIDVANGKSPKAEMLGFTESSIAKICNYT